MRETSYSPSKNSVMGQIQIDNSGMFFVSSDKKIQVFESEKESRNFGISQETDTDDRVFVGNCSMVFNGKKYFFPGFGQS